MTFDSDGRDLAYQAERLAADKRDDDRSIANAMADAILLAIILAPLVCVYGPAVITLAREAFK